MKPGMSIEYRVKPGFLTSGTFDYIPENAFGAYIGAAFPVVGADGEFRLSGTSYNLFVGKTFEISELLELINKPTNGTGIVPDGALKEKLLKYSKEGFTKIVLTKSGVVPLNNMDAVFLTQEEMATAISKIHEKFRSINISIEPVKTPIDIDKSI